MVAATDITKVINIAIPPSVAGIGIDNIIILHDRKNFFKKFIETKFIL